MTRFPAGNTFRQRLTGTFRKIEADAHADIQARNAEPFVHLPMITKPNYPASPDPDRSPVTVCGTFLWAAATQRLGMRETEVVTRKPVIEFNRNDLPNNPRQGDIFRRVCDGNDFEVASVEKDGMSGLCVNLIQLGLPS